MDPTFWAGVAKRFWPKVNKRGRKQCWLWQAGKNKRGYGQIKINRKQCGAHRVLWEMLHGPIADGLEVCHTCDIPACVNPNHLFLGTRDDNMRDRDNKGRTLSREHHPMSKLTEVDVRWIRSSLLPHKVVAKQFGVSDVLIGKIRRNELWKPKFGPS